MKEAHLEGAISSKSSVSEWSHPVHESILSAAQPLRTEFPFCQVQHKGQSFLRILCTRKMVGRSLQQDLVQDSEEDGGKK